MPLRVKGRYGSDQVNKEDWDIQWYDRYRGAITGATAMEYQADMNYDGEVYVRATRKSDGLVLEAVPCNLFQPIEKAQYDVFEDAVVIRLSDQVWNDQTWGKMDYLAVLSYGDRKLESSLYFYKRVVSLDADTLYEALGVPDGEAHTLKLNLQYNLGKIDIGSIDVELPPRLEVDPHAFRLVSFDDGSATFTLKGDLMQEGMEYDLRLVDQDGPGNLVSASKTADDTWKATGLTKGKTYNVQIRCRRDSSEGSWKTSAWTQALTDGNQPLTVTPGESLQLSITNPKVGDVIQAVPGFDVPEGAKWQWYYQNGDNLPTQIKGATDSYWMVEWLDFPFENPYSNCKVWVELTCEGEVIQSPQTEPIPAATISVQRITTASDGSDSTEDLGREDGYNVHYNDNIRFVAENVSDVATQVWMSNFEKINNPLVVSYDKYGWYGYFPVHLKLENAVGSKTVSCQSLPRYIYARYVAPEVSIDYDDETLNALKPTGVLPPDYAMTVKKSDAESTESRERRTILRATGRWTSTSSTRAGRTTGAMKSM